VKFSLATGGGKKKDGVGEWPTDWHSVVAFNQENAGLLKKGQKVTVKGRLSYSKWEDKATGQKRERAEVIANEVEADVKAVKSDNAAPRTFSEEIDESEIPF
jgi:single stranded DNA-binding protein